MHRGQHHQDRAHDAGEAQVEADRAAVRGLFQLMSDVVTSLGPWFQIIVCDHANLDEDWFREAVGDNNWRNGIKLIPEDWPEED
ncbi:DUF3732 domain-containing protein [Pseudonocardia charpentierae]|uniref:DUF3732 domain-containing protein n=1 Tax=Pseudonocardia charpentierae TaxID=3075545 RepID=UPI0037C57970